MAQAKHRKKPRLTGTAAAVSLHGQRGTAAVQGGESDSDSSDVLPASYPAFGAEAYEALVGALDVPASRARHHASSARHKKTKFSAENVSEHWRQQRATQEAARAETAATSQNDITQNHGNGHVAQAQCTAAAEQQTDLFADHFNQHYQQKADEQSSPSQGVATAEASASVPEVCKSEWPDAEWMNIGQPFPKVGLHKTLSTSHCCQP